MKVEPAESLSGRCAVQPRRLAVVGVAVCLALAGPASAAIKGGQFKLARGADGALALKDRGQTWGTAWGDFNGDGYPDVWLTKHQYVPSVLLRNNRDGTFSNVINRVVPTHLDHLRDDTHGAAWADFDGDGDEDLIEASGGGSGSAASNPRIVNYNNLWVNNGGVLSERAVAYGIDYARGRSRTPVWLDYDRDGALDVMITARQSLPTEYPSAMFRQTPGGANCARGTCFEETTLETGFAAGSCYYGLLSDLDSDGVQDILCADVARVQAVYDPSTIPFTDLRSAIGEDLYSVTASDLVIADFNGDLAPDVITAKVPPAAAAAMQVGSNRIQGSLPPRTAEQGFSFAATGDVQIEFGWDTTRSDIFLGADAVAPPLDSDPGLIDPDSRPHHVQLVLSASNPAHIGLPAVRTAGIYIGRVGNRWEVRAVKVGGPVDVALRATSVSALQSIGAVALDQGNPGPPSLFVNQGGMLVKIDRAIAFTDPVGAISTHVRSFVAGDFDNDMDLDLYVGASGRVTNLPNLLFDNQGDGTFRVVANGGGASGSILGATDTVTTVDYDRDGFLDLFVSNGNYPAPIAYAGVQQLFHNQGNRNHWVELDLEGVSSNRHGIGATVFASTPDGKVQLREQDNGMHLFAQNHRRLHFGLGPNRRVSLEVHWPSGMVDQFSNLSADKYYALTEGSGDQTVSACGAPTYDSAVDAGLYLWEANCGGATRTFKARAATGGAVGAIAYAGRVAANRALGAVTPISLESNDVLTVSRRQLEYQMRLRGSGQDGFNFEAPSGASVCFGMDLPTGTVVRVGRKATPVVAPFDLTTFKSCALPPAV